MIDETTKSVISSYVDEYLSDCRHEVISIGHDRSIKEGGNGFFIVEDKDIIVDPTNYYEKLLVHPIEDFFVPESVSFYTTEFTVKLKLPLLKELIDFESNGVISHEDLFIDDSKLSNDHLANLIGQTCFDPKYQELFPEVRNYLEQVYLDTYPLRIQNYLDRLRPFLGV